SSRRRHTRSKRDWSSDVCSSDLDGGGKMGRRYYKNKGKQTQEKDERENFSLTLFADLEKNITNLKNTLSEPNDLVVREFTVRNRDRKSTRLNSSHVSISYAVFCL